MITGSHALDAGIVAFVVILFAALGRTLNRRRKHSLLGPLMIVVAGLLLVFEVAILLGALTAETTS